MKRYVSYCNNHPSTLRAECVVNTALAEMFKKAKVEQNIVLANMFENELNKFVEHPVFKFVMAEGSCFEEGYEDQMNEWEKLVSKAAERAFIKWEKEYL